MALASSSYLYSCEYAVHASATLPVPSSFTSSILRHGLRSHVETIGGGARVNPGSFLSSVVRA